MSARVFWLLPLLICALGAQAALCSIDSPKQNTGVHGHQQPDHRQHETERDYATAAKQSVTFTSSASKIGSPTPPVWPERFKATLFQNRTGRLALTYLYYDWKLGANLNLIANQLGKTVWDLEWNNGTSFIFSRDEPVCKVLHFDVGILTPDWLKGSTHLGQTETDTFVVDVWTKADFINYYASVDTGLPVRWTFLWSSAEFHVMSFEEGTSLPKHLWQAPPYCFTSGNSSSPTIDDQPLANGQMFRLKAASEVERSVQQRQQQQQQQQQQQEQQRLNQQKVEVN